MTDQRRLTCSHVATCSLLAVALALAARPTLSMIDEPAAGLNT
ncbi:hypothetical protein [Paraburkholderia solitsugae]|nr:hypothetical protein [Paraburkholderia solitsugae]